MGYDRTFDGREIHILLITSLGHAVCHLGELIFPSVMVAVMREFGLAADQATQLAILGYALMGAGALPVGLWADAGDPWNIHFFYFVAMFLSCCAVAIASTPLQLFASLTCLGLATSIYHPTALAILSLGVRRSSLAMGINGVAGSIGIALAPVLGQQACLLGAWQIAYFAVAAVAGLSALMMLATWHVRFHMPPPAPVESVTRASQFPWLLLGIMVLGGFNYRCLMTALPSYLDSKETGLGGWATALAMSAGCVGQILGGKLGDRLGCRPVYLSMVLTLVPIALLLGLSNTSSLTVILAAGYSLCMFGQQPVENTLLAENTSNRRRSLSYGVRFVMTFGIGAIGTQVVGSFWHWTGSLQGIFFLLAGSTLLMAGLLAWWLRTHPDRARVVVTAEEESIIEEKR